MARSSADQERQLLAGADGKIRFTSPLSLPSGHTAGSARSQMRAAIGSVALVAALSAVMFPLRTHLSLTIPALVLIIPVVVGVTTGGFIAGVVATVTGFFAYDFIFIPPYYTLYVGAGQNWVALAVYAVVMVAMARVVAQLRVARAEAVWRANEVRRLFDLSEMLVRESAAPELFETIVATVVQAFRLDGAALLLPNGARLELVASAGIPLTPSELLHLSTSTSSPVSLEAALPKQDGIRAVALTTSGKPIGLLALRGLNSHRRGNELLRAFANHMALALERTQLREQAVRVELLAEIDRLRRSLVGAVSHDLRTPLATIKVSTSTLLDQKLTVTAEDSRELLGLIDTQADRLNRLVSNLLDMTRIQSGALELRRQLISVPDLLQEALAVLGGSTDTWKVKWLGNPDLPLVDVDHVLICQVLVNLIDNATRHNIGDAPVIVAASCAVGTKVEVSVSDSGPGVPEAEKTSIFQMFNRREAGGRGGLGLAIAHAFVEVHGERIWVEDEPLGGARFVFTLPCAQEEAHAQRA